MKKIFIYIFISCSLFIVMGCFITKSRDKPPVYFQTILTELHSAKLGYDIENDIKLLTSSMNSINQLNEGGSNVLDVVKNIGKAIYYFARFVVAFVFDTLVATLNVIILVLRCVGFASLNYIRVTKGGGVGTTWVPGQPVYPIG